MMRVFKAGGIVFSLMSTILACVQQFPPPMFTTASGSPLLVGSRPSDVALGNANGDGVLDILTANRDSKDVTVLLGDGTGEFRTAPDSPFPVRIAPHLIAFDDLNGDGRLDIALTSHDSNDVTVLLGNGQGGFKEADDSPLAALSGSQPHNHGLLLGDVNGDSHLDIVTANQNDDSVSILLGKGGGFFQAAGGSPFAVGGRPYNPALGDVNQDGNLDLVTPNFGSADVTVLLGDGTGRFASASDSPYPLERGPYFATLGDISGDGQLDLIVSQNDSDHLTIMLGDGRAGFTKAPGSPIKIKRRGWKVRLGDLNGDGWTDLMTGTDGNSVVVLLGNGRGDFEPAPGSPFATGRGPWGVQLGDLNGDGKLDIVTANSDDDNVTVLLAR